MKMVVKNKMMFSYPYFKPPYYNQYSRYGYYYPNALYNSDKSNIFKQQPNIKHCGDTIHTKKVQNFDIKNEYNSNTNAKGHNGVCSTTNSYKRYQANGFFLYEK